MKEIHDIVRNDYGKIALEETNATILSGNSSSETMSSSVGYTPDDLALAPVESNLGLGCGNPHRKADIQPGEIVLDLGSGAGLDCFIAGKVVGRRGRAIGVDMTPEMLSRARKIAKENRIRNVEFRLGEIENLPNAIKIVSLALGLLMSVFLIVSSICLTTNQEFIAKFFAH